MDLDSESLDRQNHDNQSIEPENEEEYETQSDDDPWQDTELIDYWDASLTGYKSYHNKDENPAVLIPAPTTKKKTLGKRKRVQFEDQAQETKKVEQEPAQDETPAEQQQGEYTNYDQQYDHSEYHQYYQQQYPQTAAPPPPPPPPPMPGMAGNGEEGEAFSNLIMAWYYSGYYTGYYQARYRNRNG